MTITPGQRLRFVAGKTFLYLGASLTILGPTIVVLYQLFIWSLHGEWRRIRLGLEWSVFFGQQTAGQIEAGWPIMGWAFALPLSVGLFLQGLSGVAAGLYVQWVAERLIWKNTKA